MARVRVQLATWFCRGVPFWVFTALAPLFVPGRAAPHTVPLGLDGGTPDEGGLHLLAGQVPARLTIALTLRPDSCATGDTVVVAWCFTNHSDHASRTPPVELRLLGTDGAPVPLEWGHQLSIHRELAPTSTEEIRARIAIEPPDPRELAWLRELREASPKDRARMCTPPAGVVARHPDLVWVGWPTDIRGVAPGTYRLGVRAIREAVARGVDVPAEDPWVEALLVVLP